MALRVELHPDARARAPEWRAGEDEIISTVLTGERFLAKFGRVDFRRNFSFGGIWRGKRYATKQVEAYAVERADHWLVITVNHKILLKVARVDVAPDGLVYGIELLNANEQLRAAGGGKLVLVDEVEGKESALPLPAG